MATDPKTGQIINTDKSLESIRADRSAELSNPGDEGPKIPSDLGSHPQGVAIPGTGNVKVTTEKAEDKKKEEDK